MPSVLTRSFEAGVALMIGLVIYRLLTGEIRMRGLFTTRNGDSSRDPERVQMFVIWLGGVGTYVSEVLRSVGSGAPTLPEVPSVLLVGVTGSHLLYLAGKLIRYRGGIA